MKHQTDNVPRMVRRRWRGSDEQERLLAGIGKQFDDLHRREDKVWANVQRARELGIPDTVICQRSEISRATLQRRLGHRPDLGI
jgi:hypothetical protein